jgi:hypothetical protein
MAPFQLCIRYTYNVLMLVLANNILSFDITLLNALKNGNPKQYEHCIFLLLINYLNMLKNIAILQIYTIWFKLAKNLIKNKICQKK